MKAGNLLFSAVQLIFVALLMLLGLFFIGLEHVDHLRYAIAQFFLATSIPFSFIGYLILGCGSLMLLGFSIMHRGVYYRIKMGGNEALVDPAVVHRYLQKYWNEAFPDRDFTVEARFSHDQKLEMFVEMPLLSPESQQMVMEKAEVELKQILKKRLGYGREFYLSVLIK